VAKRIGPAEMGQSAEFQNSYVKGVGRCGDQNPNPKTSPDAHREEFLWNGTLGSPTIFEQFNVMGELEQGGQSQNGIATKPYTKPCNRAATTILWNSHRDAGERRRKTNCMSKLIEQRVGTPISHTVTSKEVDDARNHKPGTSISRVEASLPSTPEGEASQLHKQ